MPSGPRSSHFCRYRMVRGLLEGSEEGRRAVRGDGRYGDADAGLGLRLMKLKIQGRRFNLTCKSGGTTKGCSRLSVRSCPGE